MLMKLNNRIKQPTGIDIRGTTNCIMEVIPVLLFANLYKNADVSQVENVEVRVHTHRSKINSQFENSIYIDELMLLHHPPDNLKILML